MTAKHQTTADKLEHMEHEPLMQQRQFDEGLLNYMVRNQPLVKKVQFIRKTYGLLLLWLFISILISRPFQRDPQATMMWVSEHSWIMWVACIFLVLQIAFYLTVAAFLLTGQNLLLLVYLKLLRAFPLNFLWTLVYVACFSYVVNAALASFGLSMLTCVFLYTAIAVLGIWFYTYVARQADFKQLYGYLVPVFTAVLIWLFLLIFCDAYDHRFEHTAAILISIMLGWIVVFDTQLIFGTKAERGRKYPYQTSMCTMAAYEMYFDLFVHFYLGSLNLFPAGESDDPSTA